jgi:hypothetical protein
MLEPISARCDMKRAVWQAGPQVGGRDTLALEADVLVDLVVLNVGQKDLATMLAVYNDKG